jgi:hypothetical protein
VVFDTTLTNTGTTEKSYTLTMSTSPVEWQLSLCWDLVCLINPFGPINNASTPLVLKPGESKLVQPKIFIPYDATCGQSATASLDAGPAGSVQMEAVACGP